MGVPPHLRDENMPAVSVDNSANGHVYHQMADYSLMMYMGNAAGKEQIVQINGELQQIKKV